MRMGRVWVTGCKMAMVGSLALGSWGFTSESLAGTVRSSDSFTSAVNQSTLEAGLKAKVVARYEELTSQGVAPKEAITECLQMAHPEYQRAMAAMESDDLATALKGLGELVGHSDGYLAADASFFLGRSYLLAGQHENAVPHLQKLIDQYQESSLRSGEALYYLGTAQAGLLQIEPAMENLIRFLQTDATAPERLKEGAYNQLVRLEQAKKNQLADAELRMGYSERRLGQALPDGDTQTEQAKVVDILSQLIEEAEKKECSGNCKGGKGEKKENGDKPGQKPGQEQQQPKPGQGQSPGQSSNANGSASRQAFDNGPISIWSQLRDRDRDPANSAVKEQLPPEYRKLIERYFREMSEGSQNP
ncbi:MAG: tetratricopeptide repeat protein [Planctomycetaceae bacterium]|jgi:tetratricopeptide (TPR) repeat protein|nr:tetratricopeptide repeat protein [Planctomycetaceae bacterium]